MKKILITVVMMLAIPSLVSASPFVVSDSFTAEIVENCIITIDGVVYTVAPVVTSAGQARCEFDVASTSVGAHHITVYTENMWGVSEPAPFDFTKELPPTLSNIRLEN